MDWLGLGLAVGAVLGAGVVLGLFWSLHLDRECRSCGHAPAHDALLLGRRPTLAEVWASSLEGPRTGGDNIRAAGAAGREKEE